MNNLLSDRAEEIQKFFSNGGALALQIKGFEERSEQKEMARDVQISFQEQQPALIEAGTGTGKSLAYLIPSILWAHQHDERIVISTNTIALQEQLIHKDIPLAMKALGLEMKYVLAKGMSNYVCLRRLDEETQEQSLFHESLEEELYSIQEWAKTSIEGSRSKLPFFPSYQAWERVSVQSDLCDGPKCASFNKCFFFKARKEAQEAKIIVVNHHLLFADLRLRLETNNMSGQALLPYYKRVIIDEAHHIEDIATEYFAQKVSRLELLKILAILSQEKSEEKRGKLGLLKLKLDSLLKPHDKDLLHFFDALATERRSLLFLIGEFFDSFASFFQLLGSKEQKLRLMPAHITHPFWQNTLKARSELLGGALLNFAMTLQRLETSLTELKSETLEEQTKVSRLEVKALGIRLAQASERLKDFISGPKEGDERVFWIQQEMRRDAHEVQLISAQDDISDLLGKNFFGNMATSILCSATLASNKSFSYPKGRLGIGSDRSCVENIYPSPFAYKKQALLGVPLDMPFPDSPDFQAASHKAIKELTKASQGNAFVLFTSYEALKSAWNVLHEPLKELGFFPIKQGDNHRHALLERFKGQNRSILFGTDSFWEGIDIVGDALRCVIITKLPFHVPSDPLSQVRCERITAKGKSAFFEYSLPKAVMKFKQAFGRLIRHKEDRGCCITLDSRIIKKNYGKIFLQSLPECLEVFEPLETLKEKMVDFYRKKI